MDPWRLGTLPFLVALRIKLLRRGGFIECSWFSDPEEMDRGKKKWMCEMPIFRLAGGGGQRGQEIPCMAVQVASSTRHPDKGEVGAEI